MDLKTMTGRIPLRIKVSGLVLAALASLALATGFGN